MIVTKFKIIYNKKCDASDFKSKEKKRVFSLESKILDLKGTFQITKKGFL